MKPYAYLRDPLFLACLGVYAVNRLLIKPYIPNAFSRSYLNDVLCIPFWVPVMLFAMRKAGWRLHDRPPTTPEVLIPLLAWSFLFESVVPYTDRFRGLAFGDPDDVLCYAIGALAGAVYWRWRYPA